ncbi:MAG: hypothetical protein LBV61_05625 [Burkholderiaceae bacterium]|jgi:hypothetical protein|nr:hypothetical protein [Burkholderiaceae bacterium]
MSGISLLTAAQLSEAAYSEEYALPVGWLSDGTFYSSDGADSLSVYVDTTAQQVVIAFKGMNNIPDLISVLMNSGGSAWESISPVFWGKLAEVQENYSGYEIMTDGHSLGGGMAQTAALEAGLSGYGQNSLPISQTAITEDALITQLGGITHAIEEWAASGNTFQEVNNAGDPATLLFSTLGNQTYLSTNTITLNNSYVAGEALGAFLSLVPGGALIGVPMIAWNAYEAHSIAGVISVLESQQDITSTTTFALSNADALFSSDGDTANLSSSPSTSGTAVFSAQIKAQIDALIQSVTSYGAPPVAAQTALSSTAPALVSHVQSLAASLITRLTA